MCCRTSIHPLVPEVAEKILVVGGFKPVYWASGRDDIATNWERAVYEDEDWANFVHATLWHGTEGDDTLELNLAPAISVFAQHYGKRRAASVYFEIAAKYAEKVGGRVEQRANVIGCRSSADPHVTDLVIASYPEIPLSYDRICPGFKAVLLGSDGAVLE